MPLVPRFGISPKPVSGQRLCCWLGFWSPIQP